MMKKNLFVLLLALILPLSFVCAENYPYRSDVLWVTVPNHADWIYKTGEKATVEVQFYKYGIPQDGVTVSYEIGGDMMPAETYGAQNETYMSRSAEKWVKGLCFNELGVGG